MSGCQDVRMSIELMDFLHNPDSGTDGRTDGRTDVGRSRDAIASKNANPFLEGPIEKWR